MVGKVVDLKNKVCSLDRWPGFTDQLCSSTLGHAGSAFTFVCATCGHFSDLRHQGSTSIILRTMMERNMGA